MNAGTTERLRSLVSRPDTDAGLAEAALLIAQEEYPSLDVTAYLKRLDEITCDVRTQLPPDPSLEQCLSTLNRVLFREQGFAGNNDDYYNPDNSFLNTVLDRKRGIPLTLSIIYMEIGRRLGLPLEGVSFPGHFLVKMPLDDGELVLDPYSGGVSLDEDELRQRLREMFGSDGPAEAPLADLLATADTRQILARMLRNLKGIYLHNRDYTRALSVVDRLLVVTPDASEEHRDRGRLHEELECFHAAMADYEHYLAASPDADDAPAVHARRVELRERAASLH